MSAGAVALASEPVVDRSGDEPIIGKDVLELISTAMYVEPLTIFREYVQNAADGIDEARAAGVLAADELGSVEIELDAATRTIRIRDNGVGVPASVFASRMRALGASAKRGTGARGFRGVGRLSGLAYAQRLVFRSRAAADKPVQELVWDCRKLRAGLKSRSEQDLREFVEEITSGAVLDGDWPERFFEVELAGVVRQGDDRLLRPETVSDYLCQVAPVPFSVEFALAREIAAFLEPFVTTETLQITINGEAPVVRPHRDLTPAGPRAPLALRELSTFEIPGLDGGVAAVGWLAHHDYDGAIPAAALVKGLRARVGDLQIGGSSLLEEIFPETRFCSWTVGDVHVLDPRIVPNGRRDNFEQNIHLSNFLNHLGPIGRDIARRCRTSSAERQRMRNIEMQAGVVDEQLGILEQGALGDHALVNLAATVDRTLAKLEKAVGAPDLLDDTATAARERVEEQRRRLEAIAGTDQPPSPLERLPEQRRVAYQEMIDLIYECSANRVAAKSLVDRILARVSASQGHAVLNHGK